MTLGDPINVLLDIVKTNNPPLDTIKYNILSLIICVYKTNKNVFKVDDDYRGFVAISKLNKETYADGNKAGGKDADPDHKRLQDFYLNLQSRDKEESHRLGCLIEQLEGNDFSENDIKSLNGVFVTCARHYLEKYKINDCAARPDKPS